MGREQIFLTLPNHNVTTLLLRVRLVQVNVNQT